MVHSSDGRLVFLSAAKLMSGTGAAQITALLSVPLITRLYTTSDFGAFGVFMAATTLLSVLVTGRYESAIPLPADDREGWELLALALVLGSLGCSLGLAGALLLGSFELPQVGSAALLLPFSIWLAMGIVSSEFWLNRRGRFGWVSFTRFTAALGMVSVQILFGWMKWGGRGLIYGFLFGMTSALILNFWKSWQIRPEGEINPGLAARRYSRFPKFLLAAQVCNSAANHLPTVFLGGVFGASLTGAYTVANRAMTFVDLIATVVGQAFYPQAAKAFAAGRDCYPLLKATMARLFFFAILFFPAAWFAAPWFFALVFGAEWRVSGELVRLVLPMFFTRFIFVPAGLIPMIAGRQEWYLYRQVGLFVLVALSLAIGWAAQSYRVTLLVYSLVYSFLYLIDGFFAVQLVRRERHVQRAVISSPGLDSGLE